MALIIILMSDESNKKLKAFEYFFLTYYIEKIRANKGSRQEVLYKKDVFKNFTKLIGKKLCRSLFLIKFQAGSLQRDFGTSVFPSILRIF